MKRALTVWRLMAVVLVCGSASTSAQEPSMAETKRWLETEAVPFLRGTARFAAGTRLEIKVTSITFLDCNLSLTEQWDTTEGSGATMKEERTVSIPMKDVDAGSIAVRPADGPYTEFVSVATRSSVGKTISSTMTGKPTSMGSTAMLFVVSTVEGQRVVNAVRRAAALCGASTSAF